MSRVRDVFVVLFVVFSAASLGAQVQTGSILVRVSDEQGGGMPGVTITITSSALVAGTMDGVSDTGGAYRFPSLPPGTYTVKTDLTGFQTIVRENVVVLVGQTTPLDLAMRVASVAETITVTGASPTIDTTSANVNVHLGQELLQATPGGRDIWAMVEYKVPSLLITRPDVGGTSGGLQGTYSARGTPSSQNSQYLNGVNVGDPSAIGAAGYYYDYDAFDDVQVSTGAHDITVPTGGVFLNMVTKSGSDRWLGKGTFAWESDATQGSNVDSDLLFNGFRADTNVIDYVSDASINVGGPIIANKLRVFGSFRDWRVHVNVPAAFSQLVLDQTNITSGLINATYQVNDKNRLTGFYSRQRYAKPNRFLQAPTTTLVEESTSNEQDVFNVYQALWNSVITSRLFLDARFSLNTILFPTYLNGTDQTLLDQATNIRTRNFTAGTERFRDRYQGNATAQYFIDNLLGGRHELRFGFDHAHAPVHNLTERFDDVDLTYNSTTGRGVTAILYGTPFDTRSAVDVTALYLQDGYAIDRLTLTGGLRWERLEAYLPEQSSPPSRFFPDIQRAFPEQRDVVLWHTLGPRLGATFDPMGDGRTALKASAGRYYYIISSDGAPISNVNPNANFQRQYTWNDANGDLRFQDGEQVGPFVETSGTTTTVSPDYRRPYTDEYSAGVDRELIPAVKLSAVYTYRREKYPTATINPLNPFSTTLTTRPDTGRDGVAGTSDDGTYQFYDRILGANQTLITNDPTALQSYKGIEVTLTKRMSERWQALVGYTYSQTDISGLSANVDPNRLLNAEGPLANGVQLHTANVNSQLGDRPHQFKLTGSYILPFHEIQVGANFLSQSGIPVTRQVNATLSVGGTTPVNVEPLGSERLDLVNRLDLRVAKTFSLARGSLEGALDIHNVSNANTAWDARVLSGTIGLRQDGLPTGALNTVPQFLSPASILGPRVIRFNVSYRF